VRDIKVGDRVIGPRGSGLVTAIANRVYSVLYDNEKPHPLDGDKHTRSELVSNLKLEGENDRAN